MQVTPSGGRVAALFTKTITDLRMRIDTAAKEVVTGQHSDLTKHLNGRVGKAMIAQKAVNDIAAHREQLEVRASRLTMVQFSLGNIQDRIDGIDARVLSAIGSGDAPSRQVAVRSAADALTDTFMALNSRHADRFLFAGQATSTPPLASPQVLLADIRALAIAAPDAATFQADIDAYFNDPAGPWQTLIYRGSAAPADSESIIAADPALTRLISGLAVVALGGADDNIALFNASPDILQAAAGRIGAGRSGLTDLRADIGMHQERVSRLQIGLDTEETVLKGIFGSLVARDQYEAASELKQIETSIEASYMITARLANLTLLNFLR
jgi:flagellar hook-associated protein 3 FlgL